MNRFYRSFPLPVWGLGLLVSACQIGPLRLAPPPDLSEHSTVYPVRHYWGLTNRRKMQIGEFRLTSVHTGLPTSHSRARRVDRGTFQGFTDTWANTLEQRLASHHFRFEGIGFGQLPVRVSAREELAEKNARTSETTRVSGTPRRSTNLVRHYEFTATVSFPADSNQANWELTLYSDSNQGPSAPDVQEQAILTDLRDLIVIEPEMRSEVIEPKTGQARPLPFPIGPMMTGYSFYQNDEPIGYVSTMTGEVWLADRLDAKRKTLLCAVSTAFLKQRVNPALGRR